MKRIFSIVLVTLLLVSMATVASAKEIVFTIAADASYDGSAPQTTFNAGDTFYLMVSTNAGASELGVEYSLDTDVFKLAQYEGADDADFSPYLGTVVMNPNGQDDKMSVTAVTTAARPAAINGAYIGLTIDENAPSGDYTIAFSNYVAANMAGNTASGNSVTIKINGSAPVVPQVETVEMAAPAYMTEATLSEETSGWQVGQGVALKFTVADLAEFDAMNWKLTCANIGTKYAKVADEDFAAIKASSAETIDVFASFIVNSKDAKETVNAITAVGAGFKKADGTVVETK